jgi:predicted acyltransferase
MKADFDGIGLADWVFPDFYSLWVWLSFCLFKRITKGELTIDISRHILTDPEPFNNRRSDA